MALIDQAEVAIGDYLRDKSDHREGRVIAIDGDLITLLMWDDCPGDPERRLSAVDLYRNPPTQAELLKAEVDSLTSAVDQLILDALMGGM